MISKIAIQNFKSLKNIEIECSNLNLLTGLNGMGKSSIIQTLLLLRQSYDKGYLSKEGLTLKGDLVNIGTGKDALCQYADREEIVFNIYFSGQSEKWQFGYRFDSDVLPFSEESSIPQGIENLELFNSHFKYLNTEHHVKNQYDKSDFQVIRNKSVGKYGEYAAHYLSEYGTKEINKELLHSDNSINTLNHQVSAWLGEISPGINVIADKIKGVDAIKLSYTYKNSLGETEDMVPTNVGFGITYAFPTIIMLLSSEPGDIILIENPETHLHPQGQSAIAKLIALTAEQGVQIFIESHSDHIINGILVSINQNHKKLKKGINSKNVRVNFFERDKEEHIAKVSYIEVLEDGKIKGAPEGFFDQFSKDMKIIMGF